MPSVSSFTYLHTVVAESSIIILSPSASCNLSSISTTDISLSCSSVLSYKTKYASISSNGSKDLPCGTSAILTFSSAASSSLVDIGSVSASSSCAGTSSDTVFSSCSFSERSVFFSGSVISTASDASLSKVSSTGTVSPFVGSCICSSSFNSPLFSDEPSFSSLTASSSAAAFTWSFSSCTFAVSFCSAS